MNCYKCAGPIAVGLDPELPGKANHFNATTFEIDEASDADHEPAEFDPNQGVFGDDDDDDETPDQANDVADQKKQA